MPETKRTGADGKEMEAEQQTYADDSNPVFACPKCKDTFFVYEGEEDVCPKCKVKLIQTCEWCNLPQKECTCGKDELKEEEEEDVDEHEY